MRSTALVATFVLLVVARAHAENPWVDPLKDTKQPRAVKRWPFTVSENNRYIPTIETNCGLVFQVEVDNETTVSCCESCELGYYLTNDFVTTETTNWEDRVILKGAELVAYNRFAYGTSAGSGSGSEVETARSQVSENSQETVAVLKQATVIETRPCSRCVDQTVCFINEGTINNWHRTCMY